MSNKKIDQKEYLKKYLSDDVGANKKKKKKKSKNKEKETIKANVQIVDDNLDLSKLMNATEDDVDNYALGEDLPQIAGIIDERPPETIAKESGKWKSIGSENETKDREERKTEQRSEDASPKRRKRRDSDSSPIRQTKRNVDSSPKRRTNKDIDVAPPTKYSDSSPRRRSNRDIDASPPRKYASPKRRTNRDIDASSPRKRRSADLSPKRKFGRNSDWNKAHRSSNTSPKNGRNSPNCSSRRSSTEKNSKARNIDDSRPPSHGKMDKTLDGKKAGLQSAKSLREENEQIKKRENEMYRRMAEKYGNDDDSQTVRDRKTGKQRNVYENAAQAEEKAKKEEKRKGTYTRWGAGLKQIEEFAERIANEAHEMNKPMARYADDKDLEEHLRNENRDGDPMAEYFRKKRKENQNNPSVPIYQGSFPENRFNIRPGYRWDGVDRSNGYEKKWFDVQNKKMAVEEEAYKYSVEDM